MSDRDCALCRGADGDEELMRTEVWSDDRWRLTTVGEVAGFSYVVTAMKAASGADLVYAYVFGGGIPHLHVHLAPYVSSGPLNDQMVKGDVETRQLPSGASLIVSKEFPLVPEHEHREMIDRLREGLGPRSNSS